ncbi:MAG TPA: amino acid ABC transporter permease [Candidatus Tectomicrobia bacterium]
MRGFFRRVPGWLILLAIVTLLVLYSLLRSPQRYGDTLQLLASGILVTVRISLTSLIFSLIIGFVVGLTRTWKRSFVPFLSGLYIEVIRGTPLFVTVLYVAFVLTPLISRLLGMQNVSEIARAIIALSFAEGAFMAEDIRAGIESIGPGQMEAAKSIGLSYPKAMRFVILPQALRNIMPTLGNDFIGLLKDSSLASLIAVRELTYFGRISVGLTFDTFTTWNMVTILYLMLTLSLTAGLAMLERKVRRGSDA